jgi:polyisoprenoid-binding protein YceI
MRAHYPASLALVLAACSGIVSAATPGPANPNPAAVTGGSYTVEPSHTRVQFSVSHMGFTDWYGDMTGVSGTLVLKTADIAASAVDISLPVASVATTNAKLDDELRSAQWFDAARYPTVRFVSTRIVQTGPATATITGNLTFHGITRPVTLAARFNGAGINPLDRNYTIGFNATTTIRRSDFGVSTYVPLIGDTTELRISAAFVRAAD